MKKTSIILIIGFVITAFIFTTTSCTSNNNPTPIYDTIYIHDTIACHQDTIYNCFGAVACYPFDGNANDVSGNNFHGTVLGATLTTGHKGNAKSAYYFNKSASAKIELPQLNNFDNSGEISLSFWAKTDATAGFGTTIISTTPDASNDRFQININWSGIPANTNIFDYGNILNNSGRLVSPASTIVFDTWEHYVFVKSATGNFMKIYKNGIEIATKTGGAAISNKAKKVVLGGSEANDEHNDQLFKGSLDDLKIFNRALSISEVSNIYNTEM
ncbi:MAG TPA: LamG domain-containing protein [Chitinophagales bacterium]|nr:LamG domain-containing protein [Chitinophagales bacterium]HNF19194.1 LamG domain-containing protein [Chitinophagales bacterium]HNF52518.1 LamG domain-containing protein [Chitinophagales bacterium]HNG71692.1 LamG domain-containing protein [Chitinophagales bacterium]HNK12819.1 LamG domain-containing protein [Chitinophagales bacterium]